MLFVVGLQALLWLQRIVVACAIVNTPTSSDPQQGAPQLLFYPRYHLDNSSLLTSYPLSQASNPSSRIIYIM